MRQIKGEFMDEETIKSSTEYCNKCGLLHDQNDGECLGCERQKEITQLKSQIEKMKCCENCADYSNIDGVIKCHERLPCNNYDAWKSESKWDYMEICKCSFTNDDSDYCDKGCGMTRL